MNHHIEDSTRERSQKKEAAIRMMMRTGSWATVKMKRTKGGPKARKVQPKNSAIVIFSQSTLTNGNDNDMSNY